jgi:hypothetical protein
MHFHFGTVSDKEILSQLPPPRKSHSQEGSLTSGGGEERERIRRLLDSGGCVINLYGQRDKATNISF